MYLLPEDEIRARVDRREVSIGVIGLGRVGLPLAATLAGEGFQLLGVDIDVGVVRRINSGQCPFAEEAGLEELLQRVLRRGGLRATTSIGEIKGSDLMVVTVPTLLKENEPDLQALESAGQGVGENLSPGVTVVVESTVPPLTTQGMVQPLLERVSGLKAGRDFGLAYSPERVQAPQVLRDLRGYPKIVGGVDEKSTLIVSAVYSTFAPSIIRLTNPVAAELAKVLENTYRDVNIAFANEVARICDVYGLDVHEVIKAACSQPYCHILNPGLVGGHCIPVAPYYLSAGARKMGYIPRLIETGREVNESMVEHIASLVEGDGRRVTILGLSFKPDVKYYALSHTLKLVDALQKRGCDVTVHDPFLQGESFSFKTEKDLALALQGSDCLVLSTAHSEYQDLDLERVRRAMRGDLVIDIRGILNPEEVRRHDLRYKGLGRAVP